VNESHGHTLEVFPTQREGENFIEKK